MRDDDAPVGHPSVYPVQLLHYILVRQAVEAVADDAFLREMPRECVEPGDAGHPAVERGVESRYLRHPRPQCLPDGADRCHGGAVVERCELHELLDGHLNLGV